MNVSKYFKIVLCAVLICILIVSGFGFANYMKGGPGEEEKLANRSENGDINILFMATDKGGLLTDTIMLASVSDQYNMVNILSIPRDTKVKIKGNTVKINSAYGMDKEGERINLPIDIISEITGMDINYYAVVNPKAVVTIVDLLGGVQFDVPQRMYYVDPTQDLYIDLHPGNQLLDGKKAEQYLRFRSGYATADLGRISAQQEFLKAMFEQKFKLKYITKASSIYKAVQDHVDTNISLDDIGNLSKIALKFSEYKINTYQLPGVGGNYFTYDPEETDELIQSVFLNHIVDDGAEEVSSNKDTEE